MKHLFIINPIVGRKDRTAQIRRGVESLILTDPYEIAVTDGVGAATRIAAEFVSANAHEDDLRIYACGGDGTLTETAEGVFKSGGKAAVGVVPIGSGNDFVKSLGVPPKSFRDLRAQTRGSVTEIDLLSVSDKNGLARTALNIISAGFDAAVAKGQERFKRLPLVSGSAAYNISLAQCLFTKRKHRFRINMDGVPFDSGDDPNLFAIAANGCYYGGGFRAAPYADLSDGLMDFIRIRTVSVIKLLGLVGKFRKGMHIETMKDVTTFNRCKSIQLFSDEPIDVNIDGEIVPMIDPTIAVLPKALRIILPASVEE